MRLIFVMKEVLDQVVVQMKSALIDGIVKISSPAFTTENQSVMAGSPINYL